MERNFDRTESTPMFIGISFVSVIVGLTLGGFLDGLIRKQQNDDDNWRNRDFGRAMVFFFAQALVVILVLFLFTKLNDSFVPWLQLSISGALFSVLLFTSQRNLVDNVLRLTNF
jgi:hypothetical protein